VSLSWKKGSWQIEPGGADGDAKTRLAPQPGHRTDVPPVARRRIFIKEAPGKTRRAGTVDKSVPLLSRDPPSEECPGRDWF